MFCTFQSLAFMHVSCIWAYSSSTSDSPLSLPDPLEDPVESGMTTSFRYVTYNVISQCIGVSYRSVHNYSRGDSLVQPGHAEPSPFITSVWSMQQESKL